MLNKHYHLLLKSAIIVKKNKQKVQHIHTQKQKNTTLVRTVPNSNRKIVQCQNRYLKHEYT